MSENEPMARSLADQLTSRIREAILTGKIPAGARLRIAELEATYGVSQIPLREAIRRLEAEALVETEPHRGARAASMSLKELDDLYDLRRLVEVGVARRAVGRHTAGTIAALEADIALLDRMYDAGEAKEYPSAHRRFHWDLLAPGANDEIERLLLSIWRRTGRYVQLAMTAFGSGPTGQGQHRHLLDLLRAGDADAFASELEEHLNLTQASIHDWYEAEARKRGSGEVAGSTDIAGRYASVSRVRTPIMKSALLIGYDVESFAIGEGLARIPNHGLGHRP